jgi:hypothetical protein
MDHKNGREALLLVGERPGLEPPVERRLATGEFREIVGGGQRLGIGDRKPQLPVLEPPASQGAVRRNNSTISGTEVAGPASAAMKALKPEGLIRMGIVSISTSSAARTTAVSSLHKFSLAGM